MKTGTFIDRLDDGRLIAEIEAVERKSSGEIRVYVAHVPSDDALAAAQARFHKLGMSRTRQRNGVLIYFAPQNQKFAIWGDIGVHEKCGEEFWQEVVSEMTPLLKAGQYTEALVCAIRHVGNILARHFPREPGDINELPNQIDRGPEDR